MPASKDLFLRQHQKFNQNNPITVRVSFAVQNASKPSVTINDFFTSATFLVNIVSLVFQFADESCPCDT